jgi:hypothetical protein
MKFPGFKIGKPKEKNEKENGRDKSATATQIAEMEEQLNDRTDNLKKTEKKLKKLSDKVGDAKESGHDTVLPHGPIAELTIEPGDILKDAAPVIDENTDAAPKEGGEKVKVVEAIAEPAPPPKDEKKQAKAEDSMESLNKLFSDNEEEENPLANLIRSLPDVDVNELVDDLKEINDIIKDWQKK